MVIVDGYTDENSSQFWNDELKNCKILLQELDKAIYALIKTGVVSYTIDTGQDRQTVTRADITNLQNRRTALLTEISTLENRLGLHSPVKQIVPFF